MFSRLNTRFGGMSIISPPTRARQRSPSIQARENCDDADIAQTRFVGGRLRSDGGVRCRLGSALACAERFAPQSGADHDPTTPNVGSLAMTDPILKKAMEKRDAALREVERWEEWIRGYMDLSEPTVDSLDIPMARSGPSEVEPTDGLNLASSLRDPAHSAGGGNGKAVWPRGESAS
jgi:hypothetical protein